MFKKVTLSFFQQNLFITTLFVMLNLVLLSQANAQYRCDKFGLSAPPREVRLNGIWKIEHSNNAGLPHTTILTMKGWGGVSITSFKDSSENRTRNISQNHLLCMKGRVMVILGYAPFDSDTGEKVSTYSADNFYLLRDEYGFLRGINIDDNIKDPNVSRLTITYLSSLGNK